MHIVKSDQTQPVEVEPGLFGVRLVDGGTGTHRLALLRGWLEPGARHSPHAHDQEEAVTFLSGSGVLVVNGERCPVQKDDTVWIPSGVVHSTENDGEEELHFVAAFSDSLITTRSVDGGSSRQSALHSSKWVNRLRWLVRRIWHRIAG